MDFSISAQAGRLFDTLEEYALPHDENDDKIICGIIQDFGPMQQVEVTVLDDEIRYRITTNLEHLEELQHFLSVAEALEGVQVRLVEGAVIVTHAIQPRAQDSTGDKAQGAAMDWLPNLGTVSKVVVGAAAAAGAAYVLWAKWRKA